MCVSMCISNCTSLMNWSLYEYIVNLFVSAQCYISKSALSDLSGLLFSLLISICMLFGFVGFFFLVLIFFPSSSLSICNFTREESLLEAAYNCVLIVVGVYSASVLPPLREPLNKRAMPVPW